MLRSGRAVGAVIGASKDRGKDQFDYGQIEEIDPSDDLAQPAGKRKP